MLINEVDPLRVYADDPGLVFAQGIPSMLCRCIRCTKCLSGALAKYLRLPHRREPTVLDYYCRF